MFEQTRAFRIRFQLPEAKRGKVLDIRTLTFDAEGIHTFEGTLEEYEIRKRYLKNFGAVPLEEPDTTLPPGRPLPRGTGKTKVANVVGGRDDVDDVSEFKEKASGPSSGSVPQGDRQPAPDNSAGASAGSGVRHGGGASPASRPATGAPAKGADGLGSQDQVAGADDADFNF